MSDTRAVIQAGTARCIVTRAQPRATTLRVVDRGCLATAACSNNKVPLKKLLGSIQVLASVLKEHLAPEVSISCGGKPQHAAHPELFFIWTESRGGEREGG
jgi:hypothetical protein